MTKTQILKVAKKWADDFNKDYDLNWGVDWWAELGQISINHFNKSDYGYTGIEIEPKEVKNILVESCELVIQLKSGYSLSLLGYDPRLAFYKTIR